MPKTEERRLEISRRPSATSCNFCHTGAAIIEVKGIETSLMVRWCWGCLKELKEVGR